MFFSSKHLVSEVSSVAFEEIEEAPSSRKEERRFGYEPNSSRKYIVTVLEIMRRNKQSQSVNTP
jgi:hypothetical protein